MPAPGGTGSGRGTSDARIHAIRSAQAAWHRQAPVRPLPTLAQAALRVRPLLRRVLGANVEPRYLARAVAMKRNPYIPRPRCYLCKGRRVIVAAEITDALVLIPCPACSHRGPPIHRGQAEHVETMARAA